MPEAARSGQVSGAFNDFAGTDAAGAGDQLFRFAVDDSPHALKVRQSPRLRNIVRVTDCIACLGPLAADVTYFCQSIHPLVEKKWFNIITTAPWFDKKNPMTP